MLDTVVAPLEYEPGTTWDEPGADYIRLAMQRLAWTEAELPEIDPMDAEALPKGVYPEWDEVYQRAWELHWDDEGEG